jgi:RHS repeat-associated protein
MSPAGEITGTPSAPGPAYAPAVQAANPAAYWRLNESTGTAIASDSSGFGRTLTVGPGVAQGQPGTLGDATTAYAFSGSGYLSRTHEAWMNELATAFSIEFSFATTATGFMRLIGKGDSDETEMFGVWLSAGAADQESNRWFLNVRRGGVQRGLPTWPSGVTFNDGRPHRGVVTWDSTTSHLAFYVDNTLVLSEIVPGTGPLETNTQPLEIGRLGDGTRHWSGTLDEIALYSRALPASEVATRYGSFTPSSVTIAAFDGGRRATHGFLWTVTAPPPPALSINVPGPLNHANGTPIDIPVTVTGGGANLQVQVTGSLPQGLSFNATTRRITGTITAETGAQYRQTIIDDTPVRYYRFEEPTGATTTVSEINSAHTLTLTQPVTSVTSGFTDGSKAFRFTNAPGRLATGSQTVTTGTSFSLEIWYRPEPPTTTIDRYGIIANYDNRGLHFFTGDRRLAWQISSQLHYSTGTLTYGQWHHVVVVLNGTAGTFYIDGVNAGTFTSLASGYQFMRVAVNGSDSRYLRGDLDEFAAYNYALTPADVAAHYAARGPRIFTVTAIDGAQTVEQTYSWTVTPNTPPTLAPLSGRANNVGETIAPIPLSGADADGHPLTYQAAPLPPGVQVVGNSIVGTVGGSASTYNVVVTARDALASSLPQSFTWQVNDPTPPPCTYSVSPGSMSVGSSATTRTVQVTTGASCLWDVSTPDQWVMLPNGAAGVGTTVVSINIVGNGTSSTRTAVLTFSGQNEVTIVQAAADDAPADPPPTTTDPPGPPFETTGSDVISFIHTDALGSVRMITDASGQVQASYNFMPFGQQFGGGSQDPTNNLLFTGKERDKETAFGGWQSFDYFGARYYQPQASRFTSPDSARYSDPTVPQSWNQYTYVLNNPLRFTDPDGHECIEGIESETGRQCFDDVRDLVINSWQWLVTQLAKAGTGNRYAPGEQPRCEDVPALSVVVNSSAMAGFSKLLPFTEVGGGYGFSLPTFQTLAPQQVSDMRGLGGTVQTGVGLSLALTQRGTPVGRSRSVDTAIAFGGATGVGGYSGSLSFPQGSYGIGYTHGLKGPFLAFGAYLAAGETTTEMKASGSRFCR